MVGGSQCFFARAHTMREPPCNWRAGDTGEHGSGGYGAEEAEEDDWETDDDHHGALRPMSGSPYGAPRPTRLGRSPGQQVSGRHELPLGDATLRGSAAESRAASVSSPAVGLSALRSAGHPVSPYVTATPGPPALDQTRSIPSGKRFSRRCHATQQGASPWQRVAAAFSSAAQGGNPARGAAWRSGKRGGGYGDWDEQAR